MGVTSDSSPVRPAAPLPLGLRRLRGSRALATGAPNGIGRAFATQLAAACFDLVLVARRGVALDALAASPTAAHGVDCRVVAIDLAATGGVAAGTLKAPDRAGTARPGWRAKLPGFSFRTQPRRGRTFILATIMAGMPQGHGIKDHHPSRNGDA